MAKHKLESKYQSELIERLEARFPGCWIQKQDTDRTQGIPDLLILHGGRWGMLEVKRKRPAPSDYEPNQEWYIDKFNRMWFSSVIYPAIEEEVLNALQSALSPSEPSARVSER